MLLSMNVSKNELNNPSLFNYCRSSLILMFVLRGYCVEHGSMWNREKITSEHHRPTDPCPSCGQAQTCDVHWEEPRPFDDEDMDRIASEFAHDGGCNVFPGGVPGPFNPRLVIFVDHPDIELEDIIRKIRSRIRKHMRGMRTEELIFVSRHQFTMQRMFGLREKFGMLVQRWRFMDASFAPLIQFRNESQGWERTYTSNYHLPILLYGGISHAEP